MPSQIENSEPRPAPRVRRSTSAEGFQLSGPTTPIRQLLGDGWANRGLVMMLARKDFFVRFRRTSFGLVWSVGLPLVQAAVLAFVFTRVVRIQVGYNYGVFVFSGILPWTFFSTTLGSASTSIVDGQGLATKIYFPRALLPLVSVGTSLYGFVPGVFVLIGMAAVLGPGVGLHVWLILPATILMVALAVAFSLVFAALHVYFRDMRYILQAATFAWFYGSPILYPFDRVPDNLRPFIEANPATGMIQVFRGAIVGPSGDLLAPVLFTVGWTLALLIAAGALYRRFDRVFVDLL
jgi:ABC-type polysaccharide/polyol phosphate export permease